MSCRKKSYKNLDKYRKMHNAQNQRYRNRTGSYKYEPKTWGIWEDDLVLKHDMPDRELSAMLKRSVQAIQVRRCRLTKVENKNEIQDIE